MNSAGNTGQPAVGSAGTPGLTAGAGYGRRPIALAGAGPVALAAALAATLGLAAACWAVTVWRMSGMNMGTATPLGSFGFFIAVWAAMMAAMMLPGAVPAVARRAQAGGVRAVPLFVGSYLAVWALAGVLVYAVDRPHGTLVAGLVRSEPQLPGPEAPAPHCRPGCAAGAGDHRARDLDRGEPCVGSRPCPADVSCRGRRWPRSIVPANKNNKQKERGSGT